MSLINEAIAYYRKELAPGEGAICGSCVHWIEANDYCDIAEYANLDDPDFYFFGGKEHCNKFGVTVTQ